MRLTSAAIAVTVALLSAPALTAAPKDPTTSTSASIILNTPQTSQTLAAGASDFPALGDWVTFTVTYPKTLDKYGVRVQILCYDANGGLVFATAGSYSEQFKLGGDYSQWQQQGGAAQCRSDLYYWSYTRTTQQFNLLATTGFTAAGY